MLRSAAHAGASIADARTNANAAVLAHSDFFIPNLNQTLPALAATDTCAPNGPGLARTDTRAPNGGPSACRVQKQISGKCGTNATALSFPAVFQPIFQILARHCSLAFIGLGERVRVHVGNPGFIRPGGVLGDDEPEQPERGLAGHVLALEQHAAEQSLRPVIALVGRQPQPPRRLDGVLRRAFAKEVESSE